MPVNGDLRLFVTKVNNQTKAVMYRQVVTGIAADQGVKYQSAIDSFYMAKVEDVTAQVAFAVSGGNYEFSIPLASLGMTPGKNWAFKCDIGVVRTTDGIAASNRAYWSDKGGFNMADLPAQARLKPAKWGAITVKLDPTTSIANGALPVKLPGLITAPKNAGGALKLHNPYAFPIRLTLLNVNGRLIAAVTLRPGACELTPPLTARSTCLYRIDGKGIRIGQGKLLCM
jgi:hypothetical protein